MDGGLQHCIGSGDQNHPKEKEMQKRLSKESLPIAEKRREAKGKGERERYTQLNGEFQRIARRNKKAFLSDQCKEIEEKNRMGKTRDLFKKIGNIKGIFDARMGMIKDRNRKDLMETERLRKCGKNIQNYTKKVLMIQITMMVWSLI